MEYKIITKEEVIAANKAAIEAEELHKKLSDKFHLQNRVLPRLINEAKTWFRFGNDEAYIQAKMYSNRGQEIGMPEIVYAMEQAKLHIKENISRV